MRVYQYRLDVVHIFGCQSVARDDHPLPPNGDGDAGLVLPFLAIQHLPLLHLQGELAHLAGFISRCMIWSRAGAGGQ